MKKAIFIFSIFLITQSSLFAQVDSTNNKENDNKGLFTVVENMPIFVEACEDEKYITKCNMKHIRLYFTKALELKSYKGEHGSLDISFIVNSDGSVSPWSKFEGGNKIIDEEIKEMPNFYKPGNQRAIPVDVLYKVSVVL